MLNSMRAKPGPPEIYPKRRVIAFTKEMDKALKATAKQRKLTVSDLIREAIRDKITPERRAR